MATSFERALDRFLTVCPLVSRAYRLGAKWRLELEGDYVLDLYFNETLGKYGYALVRAETRVMGWDNAPHHPGHTNFPHHVHRPDGQVEASSLNGDPEHDLELVRLEIEARLS